MIKVTLHQKDNYVYRLRYEGHAGYAEHGSDIICAAVSMLTFNTLNAIERFTDEPIKTLAYDEKQGLIDVEFPRRKSGEFEPEAELLIRTLILGLIDTKEMYGEKYIQILNK
ncbi:MAG: ribosomal-processing cysteine protease Prp [Cellulosilyticum sp.]|nr:ribosomal-processing cysteine protease Prp [Cellulosilyticum sp.]